MFLLIALAIFAIYVSNVVLGALSGASFLSDVGEMLVLFGASIAFTAGILRREASEARDLDTGSKGGKDGLGE